MTDNEIIKKVNGFQGANREFSQDLPKIIEALLEKSNTKLNAPSEEGEEGQVLTLGEGGAITWAAATVSGKEDVANKVTEVTSESTDVEYPSAKAVYDLIAAIIEYNSLSMPEASNPEELNSEEAV